MSILFAQTKHKQVMIRFVCFLKPSGLCMETKLEGSRCGSGKALDKLRQAGMLVGTVVMVGRREPGDRGRCVLPRLECVTPSPRSVDCPWPTARPGPGVELVVPGEDSCALRHPSVGRHAPPALPSYTREPGFMVI